MRNVMQAAAPGSESGAAHHSGASRALRAEEVLIRTARVADAEPIARLIGDHAATGIMLPRTPGDVLLAIDDYLVAVDSHELGYRVVERSRFPEKIRRDCGSCARRFGCAEICVQRRLADAVLEAAA